MQEFTDGTFEDGRNRLVVIEWDANGSTDPDEWDECDAGAYEFADAATPMELHADVCGAKEKALDLLHENGSGWVSILVGPGETFEDVDVETAERVISFEF